MKKEILDVSAYRKSELYHRNQTLWALRYINKWSLSRIAAHFQISVDEVKNNMRTHRQFYKQEYD